jgi:hypothetical protein
MKNTIMRVKLLLAALPAVAVLFATTTAYATAPTASYIMSGSCQSHYCKEEIIIGSNPSNYNIRAYAICNNLATVYGGWHTSGTSYAGCTGGYYLHYAGFQYDKTHQYGVQCYNLGYSRTGSC